MRVQTLGEEDEAIRMLKKENFDLRLEVYELKERLQTNNDLDTLWKENKALKETASSLTKETKEYRNLLVRAEGALTEFSVREKEYVRKLETAELDKQRIADERDALERKLLSSTREFEVAREELEAANKKTQENFTVTQNYYEELIKKHVGNKEDFEKKTEELSSELLRATFQYRTLQCELDESIRREKGLKTEKSMLEMLLSRANAILKEQKTAQEEMGARLCVLKERMLAQRLQMINIPAESLQFHIDRLITTLNNFFNQTLHNVCLLAGKLNANAIRKIDECRSRAHTALICISKKKNNKISILRSIEVQKSFLGNLSTVSCVEPQVYAIRRLGSLLIETVKRFSEEGLRRKTVEQLLNEKEIELQKLNRDLINLRRKCSQLEEMQQSVTQENAENGALKKKISTANSRVEELERQQTLVKSSFSSAMGSVYRTMNDLVKPMSLFTVYLTNRVDQLITLHSIVSGSVVKLTNEQRRDGLALKRSWEELNRRCVGVEAELNQERCNNKSVSHVEGELKAFRERLELSQENKRFLHSLEVAEDFRLHDLLDLIQKLYLSLKTQYRNKERELKEIQAREEAVRKTAKSLSKTKEDELHALKTNYERCVLENTELERKLRSLSERYDADMKKFRKKEVLIDKALVRINSLKGPEE